MFLFSNWRHHTSAELRAVYDGDEVSIEFDVWTSMTQRSSPRSTFPYAKSSLEEGSKNFGTSWNGSPPAGDVHLGSRPDTRRPAADRLAAIVSRSPASAFAWFVVDDRRALSGVVDPCPSGIGSAPESLCPPNSQPAPQYLAREVVLALGCPALSPQIARKKFGRDRLHPTTPDDVGNAFAQVRRRFRAKPTMTGNCRLSAELFHSTSESAQDYGSQGG